MKKYREVRVIHMEELKNLCIRERWYTSGNCREYQNMLSMCKKDNITTNDIVTIAQDIMNHTHNKDNEGNELESYCFEIARIAITFFKEVEDVDSALISNRILRNLDL